jgi:hypothetical protein
VICSQGFLPLAFDEPTSNCKAAVVCTLDRGPYRVLSAGPAEPRFFNEVVTPPPHPFPTWLGSGLGGFIIIIIIIQYSKTSFCCSEFPWLRERISPKIIDTRCQKGSPALMWTVVSAEVDCRLAGRTGASAVAVALLQLGRSTST